MYSKEWVMSSIYSFKAQSARTFRPPRYNCPENRKLLYGQQEGYCPGCSTHFEIRNLEVDHIIARQSGGTDHISNLQLLCGHCNRVKGNGAWNICSASCSLDVRCSAAVRWVHTLNGEGQVLPLGSGEASRPGSGHPAVPVKPLCLGQVPLVGRSAWLCRVGGVGGPPGATPQGPCNAIEPGPDRYNPRGRDERPRRESPGPRPDPAKRVWVSSEACRPNRGRAEATLWATAASACWPWPQTVPGPVATAGAIAWQPLESR